MNTFRELWRKLSGSKEYRKEFVSSMLKRGTALQIQGLLKGKEWSQAQLAAASGLTQGVISRAQNPSYGNLTFNTIIDVAAGFDVAFIGRFVPFSEFARWIESMPDGWKCKIPNFETENEQLTSTETQLPVGQAEIGNAMELLIPLAIAGKKPISLSTLLGKPDPPTPYPAASAVSKPGPAGVTANLYLEEYKESKKASGEVTPIAKPRRRKRVEKLGKWSRRTA